MHRAASFASVLPFLFSASLAAAGEPPAPESPAPAAPATPAADTGSAPAPAAAPEPGSAAEAGAAAPVADVPAGREHELSTLLPRLTLEDELLWLDAGGTRFFAFRRTPQRGKPRGAILVVPAPGRFIDETPLIRSLRSLPPAGGYSTLALQPPLTDPDAPPAAGTPAALCARLGAALTALAAEGAPMIAVAAEAASVQAVLDCNAGAPPPGVQAFAALGGWQGSFDKLGVPSIEFVPLRDPVAVAAADRRAARPVAEGAPPRRRVDIDGADRNFSGAEVEVAKRLRGWLERLPPPAQSADAR